MSFVVPYIRMLTPIGVGLSKGTYGVHPTLLVNVIERSTPFLYPIVIDGNAEKAVNQHGKYYSTYG